MATNEHWRSFLASRGALFAASGIATYGHPTDELRHARTGAIIADLSGYGLIVFDGPDAAAFLHAQLSNDVSGLTEERAALATYNSPKGRVLATLLLWRNGSSLFALLPADLAEPIRKRLSMFILRAKVRAQLADDRYVRIGLGGPRARAVATTLGIRSAETPFTITRSIPIGTGDRSGMVDLAVQLPGERFLLLLSDPQAAITLWQHATDHGAVPVGTPAWQWLAVRSGYPEIQAATQDQFVAQMLNYELLGGISFTKGCYPGQEIVARTQYRGAIKRRTYLAHVAGAREPLPGDPVYSRSAPEQAAGAVVNAAPAPEGGFDALICLHGEMARHQALRCGATDGAEVTVLDLPYPLPLPA